MRMKKTKKFTDRVYDACRKIPKGKVSTYKEIAKKLRTKAYRAVGQALKCNPHAPEVPCHRVVASDGNLGGFAGRMNSRKKMALLRKEGVIVEGGRIKDFEKRVYRF